MKEAVDLEDGKLWKEAMVDEMTSLDKNEASDLVEFPAGRKPISSKWVFKKKTNAEEKVEKYKAQLVKKEQMDVKTTFLHGDLEEEIYIKQPEGFAVKGKKELVYVKTKEGALDSNEAAFQRRSTSGYVFNLFGGTVSWMSKKQSVVALSNTEVEYMAATHASKEAVWLQRLCSSMGLVQGAIRIDCDSQSAILLAKNLAYHLKTKHVDVHYHFVRDMIEDKKVLLINVDTLKNIVDELTKSVSSEKFSWCRETMGVAELDK
eukprot:PITA_31723